MKIQNITFSKVCNLLLLFMSSFNTSGTEPDSLLGRCGFSFLGECAFYKFFKKGN